VPNQQRRRPGGALRQAGQPLVPAASSLQHDSAGNRWRPFHQCIAVSTTAIPPAPSPLRLQRRLADERLSQVRGVARRLLHVGQSFNATASPGPVRSPTTARPCWPGRPATAVRVPLNSSYSGILPANFDGTSAPPAGEQEVFAGVDTSGAARVLSSAVHFAPASPLPPPSTFGATGNVPDAVLPPDLQLRPLSTTAAAWSSRHQPAPRHALRPAHDRLQYRNFADHSPWSSTTRERGQQPGRHPLLRGAQPAAPTLFQSGPTRPTRAPLAHQPMDGECRPGHAGNMALATAPRARPCSRSIRTRAGCVRRAGPLSLPETTIVAGEARSWPTGGGATYRHVGGPQRRLHFWYTRSTNAASSNAGWQDPHRHSSCPGAGRPATSTSLTSSPNRQLRPVLGLTATG